MLKYLLPKKSVKAITGIVKGLFAKAKYRFFGPDTKGIRIGVVGQHRDDLSLQGVFDSASRSEGVAPTENLREAVKGISQQYFDAHEELAVAKVLNAVQSSLSEAEATGDKDLEEVLHENLHNALEEVKNNITNVVEAETNRAKNIGTLDAIAKVNRVQGITDPVVAFVGPNDDHTCKECRRLFFMDDGVTPRAWYMSELKHGYHKYGEEMPSIGGMHPRCFTGDMFLLTDRGEKTFKDLYNTGSINVVIPAGVKNKGDEVTFEYSRESVVKECPLGVYYTGVRPCIRFVTSLGMSIEVSEDHEMWVDRHLISKIKAKDIRLLDIVPIFAIRQSDVIVSITDIGMQPTYCITEPDTNTVVVNGIVTGNCRHSLISIQKGFGFKDGVLEYIAPDYSLIDDQRGTGGE